MNKKLLELILVSGAGALLWLLSFFSQYNRNASSTKSSAQQDSQFFTFLKQFATRGGLKNIFPGDDARDTSIQFELISQVNCTTSVGKPISLTVRNTPQDRRRMRMFGGL